MQLPTNVLKSLALFSGKDDIRTRLNGINVVVDGTDLRMTASDGVALATFTEKLDEYSDPFNIIIPIDTVVALKTKLPTVELSCDDTKAMRWVLGTTLFDRIDETYPDCQRVWPEKSKPSDGFVQYDLDLLHRIHKAKKAMGKDAKYTVWWRDKHAMFTVTGDGRTIRGIVMPMRDEVPRNLPTWA